MGKGESERERMKLTEDDINQVGWRHKEYAQISIAKAMAYLIDRDKKDRLKKQECAYCFYFCSSRIGGQAMTNWNCKACGRQDMYGNTAVPSICNSCATKHALCTRCAGDVHMRVSRRGSERIKTSEDS